MTKTPGVVADGSGRYGYEKLLIYDNMFNHNAAVPTIIDGSYMEHFSSGVKPASGDG